ncbi:MAG: hypothetical protein JO104_02445 [Candidatus Eremiobacteraeota bacterium]|nr:hypothetical protein [Candidatus Eremiobacteraeota bacterium]
MFRSRLVFPAIAAMLLIEACSGGSGTTPSAVVPGQPASGPRLVDSGISRPRFLRLMRIPNHPPPHKHQITGAMRARARAGGWQQISSVPAFTNGPQTELLMTDGTVMVQDYCTQNWFKLTPDQNGNYATGTWSATGQLPSGYGPLYFASAVLADGKLIANGGEYNGTSCSGVETPLGAIYDPVANTWTSVTGPSGWSRIGDAQSVVLSNNTYMLGNCCYQTQALLDESAMTWTQIGTGKNDPNSEEGLALLPNGDVLTVDVTSTPNSEVYVPSANAWQSAGTVPVQLVSGFEIGPETLRPDGTVWVAGATGNSAIYNTHSGTWAAGPTFPSISGQQYDVADGPSSLLPNGWVMVPASPGLYQTPSLFYIFNGKTLKNIPAPPDAPNDSSYNVRLLLLPTGQILEDDGSTDIEIYTGPRRVDHRWAPVIDRVKTMLTHGQTYKISGRRFNGASQANMYGDDVQQATNYPLVRITNNATGHVFYCRTHGTSFMGVQVRRKKVSTFFDVPSTIETGASTLVVVANGIPSQAVNVTVQ